MEKNALRALFVFPDESRTAALLEELKRGNFEPHALVLSSTEKMAAALDQGAWDIIFCAHALPTFNGLDVFSKYKSSGRDVPFLLISETSGEEEAVEAMRAGVGDYILASHLRRLNSAVDRLVKEYHERLEKRITRKRLEEAEFQYSRLIEEIPAVTYLTALDDQFKILYISPQVEDLLGYTLEEWRQKPDLWRHHLFLDDRDKVLLERSRCRRTGEPFNMEYRMVARDGRSLWLRDKALLQKDASGRPLSFRGFMFDITESKKLEEKFLQAQKMEAVGRLAGGVAHDFNNILTVISGTAEMVLQEVKNVEDPLYKDMDEIRKCTRRATDLTRQLLAFSRRQILHPVDLNLNTVLKDLEKMVRRLIGEDVELKIAYDEELGVIRADPGQMEQILMNLVINARDAMPQGGKIFLETSNIQLEDGFFDPLQDIKPGPYVLLAISDTGQGMDNEVKKRIFEPFFTTKPQGKGTGLGLAAIYGIVKQSGGYIHVVSEPGKGATFQVYFPMIEKSGVIPRETSPAEALDMGGRETLLVVEDDDGVRDMARRILAKNGYKVLEAGTPGEALIVCEKHTETIHAMVTDMVMPHMNGSDLAGRLSSLHPEMRVLFMSGYMDPALIPQALINGDLPFLQKPFRPEDLARAVRGLLDGKNRPATR